VKRCVPMSLRPACVLCVKQRRHVAEPVKSGTNSTVWMKEEKQKASFMCFTGIQNSYICENMVFACAQPVTPNRIRGFLFAGAFFG